MARRTALRPVLVALLGGALLATAAAAQEPPRRPRVVAVIAAVERHEDGRIPACPGAHAGARALRRWLVTTAGVAPDDVLLMDGDSRRQPGDPRARIDDLYPSRANLDWALRSWLPARLRPGDLAVVCASMQAAVVPPRAADPPETPPSAVLVPIDANRDDLDRTGWRVESALDPVAAPGANPVLVLLDTAPEGRGRPVRAGAPPLPARQWPDTIARWPAVAVWLAGSGRPLPSDGASPFLEAARAAMGEPDDRRPLMAAVDRLRRDPARTAAGFRTAGGLPVAATLWAADLAALRPDAGELVLQRGHSDRVLDLLATPDGAWIVTAGADSTVKLWRAADRTLWRTATNHAVGVTHLALAPDGRRLASADGAGRVWFWELPDLRTVPTRPLRPHAGEVAALGFLDDGRHALSLDATGRLLMWSFDAGGASARPLADGVAAAVGGGGRVAVARPDAAGAGAIEVLGLDGSSLRRLPGPGGVVTHRTLALAGDALAVSDTEGHVVIYDIKTGERRFAHDLGSPLAALALAADRLVALVGNRAVVLDVSQPGEPITLVAPAPLDRLALAPDGRTLAATTDAGALLAWSLGDGKAEPIPLEGAPSVVAASVALVPGQALLAGGQDGGLHAWDLPGGGPRPAVAPDRTQVAALAADDEPRYLVQITRDRRALAWDLAEGRGLVAIPGAWTAAAHLPGTDRFALLDRAGDVRLVASGRWEPLATRFERPRVADGGAESRAAFDRLAASPDGRLLAAAAGASPVVAVWEIASGRLLRTLRPHPEGTAALAFTPDGARLLTAGPDGTAFLHAIATEAAPIRVAAGPADSGPITAAVPLPGEAPLAATGHQDGSVWLWTIDADATPRGVRLDRLDGAVLALAALDAGRTLAVAGDDKAVRLLPLGDRPGEPVRLEPAHAERVRSLLPLGRANVLASGSEDGTIRLWRPADRQALGTLVAVDRNASWLAFTPDGRWDGSPGALGQLAWRREGRLLALDQLGERLHAFGLLDTLRRGADLPPLAAYRATPGPAIALDPPPAATARREITLNLNVADPRARRLRLYLNGIPIALDDPDALTAPESPARRAVRATLRHGANTIYAMAEGSEPNALEGRSNVVTVRCDAPDRPGRLHVLALGVDRYPNRPLKYSTADARGLSDFLARFPAEAAPDGAGRVVVLADAEITEVSVRKALAGLREAARPEDTVVVFVAGHTDVRRDEAGRERFCLLLPAFPFPAPPPGVALAMRGPAPPPRGVDPQGTVLPYRLIYQYLERMEARRRVVILDACQAAAAVDDPAVRRIRQNIARNLDAQAQAVRTSYLLASRRDEPALEVEALRHGLMTYLLLRGMGAPGLAELPGLSLPTADADADGLVTTAELGTFVAARLPDLAERLAPGTLRTGPDAKGNPAPAGPVAVSEATTAAFPLSRVPR